MFYVEWGMNWKNTIFTERVTVSCLTTHQRMFLWVKTKKKSKYLLFFCICFVLYSCHWNSVIYTKKRLSKMGYPIRGFKFQQISKHRIFLDRVGSAMEFLYLLITLKSRAICIIMTLGESLFFYHFNFHIWTTWQSNFTVYNQHINVDTQNKYKYILPVSFYIKPLRVDFCLPSSVIYQL